MFGGYRVQLEGGKKKHQAQEDQAERGEDFLSP